MKRFSAILAALLTVIISSTAFAAGETCVLLRFSNDTRYKNVDSASVLSDLVLEKLLASGKFNFVETKPIDQNLEAQLYDVRTRELANAEKAMNSSSFTELFEGPGFDPAQAQTIDTAVTGQIITPSITSAIGGQHGAEYLIQGNVINLGRGAYEDIIANVGADLFNAGLKSALGFKIGFDRQEAGIGVMTDLRVIKASTGEVVWQKSVSGVKKTSLTNVAGIKTGTLKISSDMYNQAMEDAAKKITEALIADLDAGKLFVK